MCKWFVYADKTIAISFSWWTNSRKFSDCETIMKQPVFRIAISINKIGCFYIMSIQDKSKSTSWQMFNRIAKTYDSVNRLLSFGLDIGWRKKVGHMLPQKEKVDLLDLATGTADQVLMLCKEHPNKIHQAIGMDLSEGMLAKGREKLIEEKMKQLIILKSGDELKSS